MELTNFVPYVLETSSCLHVTLLVFLRLLAILKPLTYRETHIKLRHTSIITIWIISISVHLVAVLSRVDFGVEKTGDFYFPYRYIVLHGFHTVPIICMVVMHAVLIWKLKTMRNNANENIEDTTTTHADLTNKKMTLMVQRIVCFVVVCYVPYLSWKHYFYSVISKRHQLNILTSEVKVNCN